MTRAERMDADVRRARIAQLGVVGWYRLQDRLRETPFAVRTLDKDGEYVLVTMPVRGKVRVDEQAARAWPDDGSDGPLGLGEDFRVRIFGKGLVYPFRAGGDVKGWRVPTV